MSSGVRRVSKHSMRKVRTRRRRKPSSMMAALRKEFERSNSDPDMPSAAYLEYFMTFTGKKKSDMSSHLDASDEATLVSNDFIEHEGFVYLQDAVKANTNVFSKSMSRMIPVGLNFEDWIHEKCSKYFLTNNARGIAYREFKEGLVRFAFRVSRRNVAIDISGSFKAISEASAWLISEGFDDSEVSIQWAFGKDYRDMDIYDLPLDIPNKIESAYPWLGKSIKEYTKAYMESKASILILIGPPGTGKTTFIKELIKESELGARVTYDTDLLFSDGFFASFMTDDDLGMLILEDADTVMGSRKEGNTMMHKFLNASDGLVSLPRKKIIFTTNLPSVNEVDPALMRRGRCYDVLHFRELDKAETEVVVKEIKGVMPAADKKSYSLAEIVNSIENGAAKVRNPIGFIS